VSRKGRDMGRVTVEIDRELYDRLGEHAHRNGQTIIGTIRVAIAAHVDGDRVPADYNQRVAQARAEVAKLDALLARMAMPARHLALFEDRRS
jgi:hypothetical protein